MTPAPTAAEVAGKLSKPMRNMLRRLPVNRHAADLRIVKALRDRGLAEFRGSVPNPGMPAWPYPAVSATPLGLAVRAILMEQDHG